MKSDVFRIEAPAKLIVFGEWAVLKGGMALGLPLTPRFVLDVDTRAERDVLQTQNLEWRETQNLLTENSWAHEVWATLCQALPTKRRFAMSSHREWPLHEGLGSSSALFLLLLEARESALSQPLSWTHIWEIFRSVPGNRGSGMDLAIQRLRTPTMYRHFEPHPWKTLNWPRELVLLHGKRKADTARAIQETKFSSTQLDAIAQSAERFATGPQDSESWQRAIHEHREVLLETSVMPPEALELERLWGAELEITTSKSVGAGGTDGLLVWTRQPQKFLNSAPKLAELGWYLSPHIAKEPHR